MSVPLRRFLPLTLVVLLLPLAATSTRAQSPPLAAGAAVRWCEQLPRQASRVLERVAVNTGWFEVYRVEEGVFAIFDTGAGLVPIRPVVEQLTQLPVGVLNSHTHYDHVGGNAEFDRLLALDLAYTGANQHGFPHRELAGEVASERFCHQAPAGLDTAAFATRPWRPSRLVRDGETIDLGGRVLGILQVPGHTPGTLALLDRAHGLLWTGDTYYDATIWLYLPETNLNDYEVPIGRLTALAPSLRRLLPAHNTASADPSQLALARDAIRRVRAGAIPGEAQPDNRMGFWFVGFAILTSKPLLEGQQGDASRGGSGLTTWP